MPDCFLPSFIVHDVGDIQTLSQIYPQDIKNLKIPDVWKKTKGRGIVVAILDTGCPYNHPDLNDNIDLSKCKNFIEDENIFDIFVGHSTFTNGVIGAIDNSQGVVGVAPEVTLVPIKVLNKFGRSNNDSVRKGFEYCLDKLNPDIINVSLGFEQDDPEIHKLIQKLVKKNIVIVCSAGNNGEEKILYPAQYEECIAVGSYSSDLLNQKSEFSSWGETLDIMAPGDKILSTYLDGKYSVQSGTSCSAPFVSGIVALLIAYYRTLNRTLTVDEIKQMLYASAIDVDEKGKDKKFGWGLINPEKLFHLLPPIANKKQSIWNKVIHFFQSLFK